MITKSGTRPLTRQPRKKFHRVYGGTAVVPDFNLDRGLLMQDQNADGAETECTAYFVTDSCTDADGVLYTPDFTYAATLFLEGTPPTTEGTSGLTALESAIAMGILPQNQAAVISAKQQGELYTANFSNWSEYQKQFALRTVKADIHDARGFGDHFTSILSAAYTGKLAVALMTPWYPEWAHIGSDGIVPMPANLLATQNLPWHMHSAKGRKTIGGKAYAIDKSWQGGAEGDRGYLYFSQEVLNAVLEVPGTAALVLVMKGSRWLPLVKIMCRHPMRIGYLLPQLRPGI